MMGYIFISYSHKDKAYVHKLQKTLQNEGFDVWIDDRIDYGKVWPKVIQKHLDDCAAFIVVMTENSYESEWVQNEVTRAQRKKKPFFALLLRGETWLAVEAIQYENVTGARLPQKKFYENLARVVPRRMKEIPHTPSRPQRTIRTKYIRWACRMDKKELYITISIPVLVSIGVGIFATSRDMIDYYCNPGSIFLGWDLSNSVYCAPTVLFTHIVIVSVILIFVFVVLPNYFRNKQKANNSPNKKIENQSNEIEQLSPTIRVSKIEDKIKEGYAYKRIALTSNTEKKLLACFAGVNKVVKILENNKEEEINSDTKELIWVDSNLVINNRANLTIGIPVELYIARINLTTKEAELVGINDNHTKLDKGKYKISIRFDGDNFSTKEFRLEFYCDGDGNINYKNIQTKANDLKFVELHDISMKLEVDTVDIEGVKTLIEPEENSLETIKRFSAILDELLRDKSFSGTGKIFINKIKNAPPFLGLENSILDLKTEMQFVEYFLAKKFKEDRGKYIRGGGSLTVTKTDNSIEDISKRIYGSKRFSKRIPSPDRLIPGQVLPSPLIDTKNPAMSSEEIEDKFAKAENSYIEPVFNTLIEQYGLVKSEAMGLIGFVYEAANKALAD